MLNKSLKMPPCLLNLINFDIIASMVMKVYVQIVLHAVN